MTCLPDWLVTLYCSWFCWRSALYLHLFFFFFFWWSGLCYDRNPDNTDEHAGESTVTLQNTYDTTKQYLLYHTISVQFDLSHIPFPHSLIRNSTTNNVQCAFAIVLMMTPTTFVKTSSVTCPVRVYFLDRS